MILAIDGINFFGDLKADKIPKVLGERFMSSVTKINYRTHGPLEKAIELYVKETYPEVVFEHFPVLLLKKGISPECNEFNNKQTQIRNERLITSSDMLLTISNFGKERRPTDLELLCRKHNKKYRHFWHQAMNDSIPFLLIGNNNEKLV